jgi:hypothetical protein
VRYRVRGVAIDGAADLDSLAMFGGCPSRKSVDNSGIV